MRECAMASFSAEFDAPDALHPELLDSSRVAIPDTAGEFLSNSNESALDRFTRNRAVETASIDWSASEDDAPQSGVLLLIPYIATSATRIIFPFQGLYNCSAVTRSQNRPAALVSTIRASEAGSRRYLDKRTASLSSLF